MDRIPITVVVPIKNEQAMLGRCLQRLTRFEDVIVVDSSSTDRSAEIAREHGARVVNFVWDGRFPKKRNWLLLNEKFRTNWVLFLDADEFLDDTFCDAVALAVASDRFNGYWLNYTLHFQGRQLRYGVAQRKLALFRLGKGLYERIDEDAWSQLDMEIHEHPVIEGGVGEIKVTIDHRDDRGLEKFIVRHKDYALWEARRVALLERGDKEAWSKLTERQHFKYRHLKKWWYPWFYFVYAYVIKCGFLDGSAGFYYAYYKAWYFLSIRLLLNEAQRNSIEALP